MLSVLLPVHRGEDLESLDLPLTHPPLLTVTEWSRRGAHWAVQRV